MAIYEDGGAYSLPLSDPVVARTLRTISSKADHNWNVDMADVAIAISEGIRAEEGTLPEPRDPDEVQPSRPRFPLAPYPGLPPATNLFRRFIRNIGRKPAGLQDATDANLDSGRTLLDGDPRFDS